jgi:hypothetical protein
MAKNYSSIYANATDSSALEQAFYLKQESVPGTIIPVLGTDFLYTLAGGKLEFGQPIESSPHRSGRHNNNTIRKKKELSWGFSTYFNINTALGSASSAEIDTPVRLLHKAMFGFENTTSGAVYNTSATPGNTFSIFEVGDKWARQATGCFVDGATLNFPGDGEATVEWSGMGAESIMIGIGKSVTANITNTVTVDVGEGKRFKAGGLVMVIKSNGTSRSSDTPSGSPRTVLSVAGDVVTLSGASLTDSDGTVNPVYLCYYEPTGKTGIDNPVTGLIGSVTIAGLAEQCVRSAVITCTNSHEKVDYCYGSDKLDGSIFVPASRFNAEVVIEMNLNATIVGFFNDLLNFTAQNITLVLGEAAGRRLEVLLPKVIFAVPTFSLPDTGSIPISFTGTAYQTGLDLADEIQLSYV